MSDPPQQYPVPDRKSCGKGNREGLPKSMGDPRCQTAPKTKSNSPSRDKSTGVETSGVSDTFGELCPGDGDVASALTWVVGLGRPAVGLAVLTIATNL